MKSNEIDSINLLLSRLDKQQLEEFIRKECAINGQFQDRFLALGAGSVFKPNPESYTSRVEDLIENYAGRHGYVEYRATFELNHAVSRILDEAQAAMDTHQWEVAVAVLDGVTAAGETIINCGDDSAGELGAIIGECFEKWYELCDNELLPEKIKSDIFALALERFNEKHLQDWDWWWDWMEIAIKLADTPEKQERVIKALDTIQANNDNRWSIQSAQKYKLEIMSKRGTPEEQRAFLYDNVSNPDFRKRLLQMAWDKGNYSEVLRLAQEGVEHDSEWAGLVTDWHKWEFKAYHHLGDKDNTLQLAQYFFLNGGGWGEQEYSMGNMYHLIKSIITPDEWESYTKTLINTVLKERSSTRLLFIYTEEKMWDKYMEYLRKNPSTNNLDNAPTEVRQHYRDEFIQLYDMDVRRFFQCASNRDSYHEGVKLLRKLIEYGGKKEADKIIAEQKGRTPRRPALIDELSKL